MKELKVVKLMCLCIIMLIIGSTGLIASGAIQWASGGKPSGTIYCPVGQTSTSVGFAWQGAVNSAPEYSYAWYKLYINGSKKYEGPNTSYSTNLNLGSYSAYVEIWEVYLDGSSYYRAQTSTTTFTVAITVTHGNLTASVSQYTQGDPYDMKTSSYISQGSIVNYSIFVDVFNVTGTTRANAYATNVNYNPILGIPMVDLIDTGYYNEMYDSKSGSITYGGTMLIWATATVPGNGAGARASININW